MGDRENTECEISLYKAVVSLMWRWSRDRREESERISVCDGVCGQMWSCNRTLLLFSPLYIMFVLLKACKSLVNAIFYSTGCLPAYLVIIDVENMISNCVIT